MFLDVIIAKKFAISHTCYSLWTKDIFSRNACKVCFWLFVFCLRKERNFHHSWWRDYKSITRSTIDRSGNLWK